MAVCAAVAVDLVVVVSACAEGFLVLAGTSQFAVAVPDKVARTSSPLSTFLCLCHTDCASCCSRL